MVRGVHGDIGLLLLAAAATGLATAGVFTTAPVTTARSLWSTSAALHGWAAVVTIHSVPLVATLITWTLSRGGAPSNPHRVLWPLTALIRVSFGAFVAAGVTRVDGLPGPGDWYGWPNRIFIVTFSAWMIAVAASRPLTARRGSAAARTA